MAYYDKKRVMEKRRALVETGLCGYNCGRPLATETMCREHADGLLVSCGKIKKNRLSAGLCVTGCGNALFTKVLCQSCSVEKLEKSRAHRSGLVNSGMCANGCGRELSSKTLCQSCVDRPVERNRGISAGDRDRLRKENPDCQACGIKHTSGVGLTGMSIDHDHDTNVVRGVLCSSCNKALGFMCEDPVKILGLMKYAERVCK